MYHYLLSSHLQMICDSDPTSGGYWNESLKTEPLNRKLKSNSVARPINVSTHVQVTREMTRVRQNTDQVATDAKVRVAEW